MKISIIACLAQNHAIGYQNKLLYHIANDLHRFKALTTGHSIIMGMKTYESLPNGALPNRRNIIISHHSPQRERCEICHSIQQALAACQHEEEVFIIGGESIYRQTIELADCLYLTIVEDAPLEADSYFPPIDLSRWHVASKESHQEGTLTYHFLTLLRLPHPQCQYQSKTTDD